MKLASPYLCLSKADVGPGSYHCMKQESASLDLVNFKKF